MGDIEIHWRDYSLTKDIKLDSWIDENHYKNAKQINKFAFYFEPLSKQYLWYQENPFEMSNIATYIKLAQIDSEVLACIILNYGIDERKRKVCGINPFVINPKYISCGYGSMIITHFLKYSEDIINNKIDVFYAGIDCKNEISIHIFMKSGFIKVGSSEDQEFFYYELKNENSK